MRPTLIGVLCTGLLALFAADAAGADRRFAVVVGYNGSDDPELEHLAYADDDAMRYSQLLGHVAERVELLTELDEERKQAFDEHLPIATLLNHTTLERKHIIGSLVFGALGGAVIGTVGKKIHFI